MSGQRDAGNECSGDNVCLYSLYVSCVMQEEKGCGHTGRLEDIGGRQTASSRLPTPPRNIVRELLIDKYAKEFHVYYPSTFQKQNPQERGRDASKKPPNTLPKQGKHYPKHRETSPTS